MPNKDIAMRSELFQELTQAAHDALQPEEDFQTLDDAEVGKYEDLLVEALLTLREQNTSIFIAEKIFRERNTPESRVDSDTWSVLATHHGVDFIKMFDAVLDRLVKRAEQSYDNVDALRQPIQPPVRLLRPEPPKYLV